MDSTLTTFLTEEDWNTITRLVRQWGLAMIIRELARVAHVLAGPDLQAQASVRDHYAHVAEMLVSTARVARGL